VDGGNGCGVMYRVSGVGLMYYVCVLCGGNVVDICACYLSVDSICCPSPGGIMLYSDIAMSSIILRRRVDRPRTGSEDRAY